jgi:hypothetical protein
MFLAVSSIIGIERIFETVYLSHLFPHPTHFLYASITLVAVFKHTILPTHWYLTFKKATTKSCETSDMTT